MQQYEYKVFIEDNHNNNNLLESKLNSYGKEGWRVFHIERLNKGDYWDYPKSIYYLVRRVKLNIGKNKQ
jgi:hypothetical protein